MWFTNYFKRSKKDEILTVKNDLDNLTQTRSGEPFLNEDKQELRQNSESLLDKLADIEDQFDKKQITSSQEVEIKQESAYGDTRYEINQKFKELKTQKINFYENSHFFGLDDSVIKLDQLFMDDSNGNISYKNKNNLKTITFLISGYTTQECQPSEKFEELANKENIESQTNLFVFFKWSDSSILRLLKTFIKNAIYIQKRSDYQQYLDNMLNHWLQQWKCSEIIKKIAYWMIKLLILAIKLSRITSTFLNFVVHIFSTAFDSFIEDFNLSYQQSKQGGTALAQYLNSLNLINKLNIDFMGHSLGTVVIAYALRNLINPARYIILMGGVATTTEIENSQYKFQMCYNFYSTNDGKIKSLEITQLLGQLRFIGTNPLSSKENNFNKNTKIGHPDYMYQCKKFYEKAMKKFDKIIKEKERKETERKEKEEKERKEKEEKANQQFYMIWGGIGVCIVVVPLLYLCLKPSE